MTRDWSGRQVYLLVGGVGVAFAGVMGAFIGAQAAERGQSVVAFGLLELPASSGAVAAYAIGVALVVLALVFGAVTVASRRAE